MENRLNRKLNTIANKLVKRAIQDPTINPKRYDERITAMYNEHIKSVYALGEKEIINFPKVELTQSPISDLRLEKIINERTFKASETTMNRLTGDVLPKIEEGIKEGRAYSKTATELRTEFTDMTKSDLQRISRTETHSVYNEAKQETMNLSEAVTGKSWVSSGLSNSREWHSDADGQTVAYDEPFIVMDEELMYPGDPSGSPENVINCACTMIPDIRYGRE